jgi:peptidoglycan hydrolase CwlO-like protein
MRPCQRKHFQAKLADYQNSIDKACITIEDQKKRISCFQGLINQLKDVMKEEDDDT